MALVELNRHEEALSVLERNCQLEPDAPEPVLNRALVHLAMGNFEQGWQDFEVRWRVAGLKVGPHKLAQPIWDGRSDITGKTIVLHFEQGLGDTILFARFAERVVQQGARVVLVVPEPLVFLMSAIPGIAQVLTPGDPLPEFDQHAPFGSLPRAFNIRLDSIPHQTPYLRAPAQSAVPADLDKSTDARPLVGVCWAGNPDYRLDHKRSISLSVFQRLLRIPGVRFVSLQQNLRPGNDSILADFDNINLAGVRRATSLADTAALISRLDLVITVDTAIGHLSGALGRPVWILLPFSAYWVWLRDRADSPWYPTVRLYRQPQPGDWESLVNRVATDLTLFAN